MKCYDPILVYTAPSQKKFYRNFSLASPIIKKAHQQVFDCGKCINCRKKKSRELAMRCSLHASLYTKNCFVTLTYDEKHPEYHNNFNYRDIQLFKKRLRQHVWNTEKTRIEIFNVHEYGKNGKKHWHLIIFNYNFPDKTLHTYSLQNPLYTSKKLEQLWPYGFNTIGDVTEASAMYQAQYTQKDFKNGNVSNDKKSHSKHSGIGKPYFLKHYKQLLRLCYIPFQGQKVPLPRYFEKLAHKHYSHFYETYNFFDNDQRKALYRPFKTGEENKEIADLYMEYKKQKDLRIEKLTKEWEEIINEHNETKSVPDFVKSGSNTLYDLKNKLTKERF